MSDTVIKAENFGKKYLEGVVPDHRTICREDYNQGKGCEPLGGGDGISSRVDGPGDILFQRSWRPCQYLYIGKNRSSVIDTNERVGQHENQKDINIL
jgi:hypothetical protein